MHDPDEELLAERPASDDPYPEGYVRVPRPIITGDEWEVIEASQRPPGYKAALACSRISTKLMLSIVGQTYPGDSDPRYKPMEQIAKIRRCCELVEDAVKAEEQ